MRTARSSPYGRSHGQRPLDRDPLWIETPWTETPPVGRPPQQADPSRRRHACAMNKGPGAETALEGTCDQAARQEVTSYRDPGGQTKTSENITLPQNSFAGGKNIKELPQLAKRSCPSPRQLHTTSQTTEQLKEKNPKFLTNQLQGVKQVFSFWSRSANINDD